MNQKKCIEMDTLYVKEFSTVIKMPFGFHVFDEHQRDKYYHNYLHILNTEYSNKDLADYIHDHVQYGHVMMRLEHPLEIPNFLIEKNFDCKVNRYYAQHIDDININTNVNCEISIVNPYRDDDFFMFMYEDTKIFGEHYAESNIKRLDRVLKSSFNLNYYQLKEQDEVIGHVNTFIKDDQAKIDDFTIKESFRNQGLGSKLMKCVLNDLKKKGVKEVYLVTEEEETAKYLYEKWHFKHVGSYTVCGLIIKS